VTVTAKPLRLVHLITSLKVGGAQAHLLKTVSRFRSERIASTVISLVPGGRVARELKTAGVPVLSLGMRPGRPGPLALLRLIFLLRSLRPHVVQTYLYHADLLGFLAARAAGVPAVFWNVRQSSMDFSRYRRTTGLTVRLCARLSPRVDRILVNSRAGLRAHAHLGYAADRMVVVPNGFELSRFRPHPPSYGEVRQELGLDPRARLVGMLARFDPQKDHETFLHAAGLLGAQHPDAHFLLAGKGVTPDNPAFAGLLAAGRVDGARLRLLGERPDPPRLLAALDVYVSSSAFGEGFTNAIGEAMACGVPCVVTEVGDSAHIVGDTGLVVPPRRPRELARALDLALSWPEASRASRGAAARDRIRKNFDINRIAAQLESLYLDLPVATAANGEDTPFPITLFEKGTPTWTDLPRLY
jgi:glycosyltransferase involved in cell wall biosynthesis